MCLGRAQPIPGRTVHRAEVTRAKAKILLQCDRGSDREAQGTGFLEEATGDRNTKRTRGSEPGKAGRARAYRVDPHGATVRQVRSAPSSQARASSANTGEPKCLAVPCPQPRNRSLLWEETSCPPCPPPRDRQLAVPKTSRGGGRAVTREEVMSTTSVRSNLAWEHWSHRKLSGRTPTSLNLRKMPLAAEGRKGWRELSRRPAAQVGVTANPGRDGEPQTRAVYRDWRRQTEGQRGKAQGRYYLVYTEESEAEFK